MTELSPHLAGLLTAEVAGWCQGVGLKARMTASPSTHSAVKVAAVRSRTAVLISSVPLHVELFVICILL